MSVKQLFKKLGIFGFVLCGLCCALPIIGVVLGVGAIGALSVYLEATAIVVLALAAGLYAIHLVLENRSKKSCGPSCDVNCSCKTASPANEA